MMTTSKEVKEPEGFVSFCPECGHTNMHDHLGNVMCGECEETYETYE